MRNGCAKWFLILPLVGGLQTASFADESYAQWSDRLSASWKESGVKTLLAKTKDLVLGIEIRRDWLRLGEFQTLDIKQEVTFHFNKLLELLNKPTVKTYEDIDWKWLEEVTLAIDYVRTAYINRWDPSTAAQNELVKQAQDILGLERKIRVFSQEQGAASIPTAISVCDNPDLDMRLFAIYHELGHLAHRDSGINPDKADQEQIYLKLHEKDFASDIKEIDELLEVGQAALPTETKLGLKLQDDLESKGYFWLPPPKIGERRRMLLWRGQEKRADLFSISKLFEQGKISAILWALRNYGMSDYVVAIGKGDAHPSDVERSLYMLGFLVSRNVDVADLLPDYEGKGVCVNSETLLRGPTSNTSVKSGFHEFLEKYQIWRESEEAYFQWKEDLRKEVLGKESPSLDRMKTEFAAKVLGELGNKTIKENRRLRSELLYYYNFLRESFQKPIIHKWDEVDRLWLHNISFVLWKTSHIEQKKKSGIRDDEIAGDISGLRIKLDMIKDGICLSDNCRMTTLHLYNYLREHFRKPKILSLDKIDSRWVESLP